MHNFNKKYCCGSCELCKIKKDCDNRGRILLNKIIKEAKSKGYIKTK